MKKKPTKKLWKWLNGRKTTIGATLAVLYLGAMSQGLIERNIGAEYLIETVLGVGLGHKAAKAIKKAK